MIETPRQTFRETRLTLRDSQDKNVLTYEQQQKKILAQQQIQLKLNINRNSHHIAGDL